MLLSELSHPNQLHGLTVSQLEEIASQIRDRHLQVVSTSGGHLGPGLGVVELTLALYQTLDLDFDKVVWDVGHQAYPHKLITGRFNIFDTLRQQKGVAGYLKRTESVFDHFGAGHASTSISAALGMAIARDKKGENLISAYFTLSEWQTSVNDQMNSEASQSVSGKLPLATDEKGNDMVWIQSSKDGSSQDVFNISL